MTKIGQPQNARSTRVGNSPNEACTHLVTWIQQALEVIAKAYPEHQVVGIDCLSLIQQFGSLHCITMQLPKGFLRSK
jgi:hypothetical protein